MRLHRVRLPGLVAAVTLTGTVAACVPPPQGPMAYEASPVYERRIISAVNFDFDSYRIRRESYGLLDNAAAALNDPQLEGLRFEINGHTDVSGRLGYNIALSMLRATAVVDYLAARGVPGERMRAQGFGPLQPFDAYNPRSPANRRVEIVALR
jgi:outer membrane protein OmpA-like peptidoglycan-associated protein